MENFLVTSYSKQEILEIFKEALTNFFADHPTITQTKPVTIEDDKIKGIQGLADYLGVSKVTIGKYKRAGVINFYQTGKTIYFKRSEIDASLFSKASIPNYKPRKARRVI